MKVTKESVEAVLKQVVELVNGITAGKSAMKVQADWSLKKLVEEANEFCMKAKYCAERVINKDKDYSETVSINKEPRIYVEVKKSFEGDYEGLEEINKSLSENKTPEEPEDLMKSFDDSLEDLEKAGINYTGNPVANDSGNDKPKKSKVVTKVVKNESMSDKDNENENGDEKGDDDDKKKKDKKQANLIKKSEDEEKEEKEPKPPKEPEAKKTSMKKSLDEPTRIALGRNSFSRDVQGQTGIF